VAEKSLTGIETSPKETVSDAIDRAAMPASLKTLFLVVRSIACGNFLLYYMKSGLSTAL